MCCLLGGWVGRLGGLWAGGIGGRGSVSMLGLGMGSVLKLVGKLGILIVSIQAWLYSSHCNPNSNLTAVSSSSINTTNLSQCHPAQ